MAVCFHGNPSNHVLPMLKRIGIGLLVLVVQEIMCIYTAAIALSVENEVAKGIMRTEQYLFPN